MLLSLELVKVIVKYKTVDLVHVVMQPIFKLKFVYSSITIQCDNDDYDYAESKQIRQIVNSDWFRRSFSKKLGVQNTTTESSFPRHICCSITDTIGSSYSFTLPLVLMLLK